MKRRTFLGTSILTPIALATAGCGGGGGSSGGSTPPVDVDPGIPADTPENIKTAWDAMRRAATYMDETVSYRGSYVWRVDAADPVNLRWGEMQASPTMCWMQQTSTPQVGGALLDAYHATGDKLFYKAAAHTADALIEAQHPAGGWGYIYDFNGKEALQNWFKTIGCNGWRLEEFQHFYDNCTFDDSNTQLAAQFILRMSLEEGEAQARCKASVDKTLAFLIDSQFKGGMADGGWSQRFPRVHNVTREMPAPNWAEMTNGGHLGWEHLAVGYAGGVGGLVNPGTGNGGYPHHPGGLGTGGPGGPGNYTGIFCGMEDRDYTNFITFNDAVMGENIMLMYLYMYALGDMSLKTNILRAMNCMQRVMFRFDPAKGDIAINPSTGRPDQAYHAAIGAVKQYGWGLQHLSEDTIDAYGVLRTAGLPAAARSYEPRGISPQVCTGNMTELFDYFRMTGDKSYLTDLEEVCDWLMTCYLEPRHRTDGTNGTGGSTTNQAGYPYATTGTNPNSILAGTHCRTAELYSNRPRFTHRYGTNIWNGGYYFDYDSDWTPSHYGVSSNSSPASYRTTLTKLKAMTNDQIARMVAASPLSVMEQKPLPKYFEVGGRVGFAHLFTGATKGTGGATTDPAMEALVDELGTKNYWGAQALTAGGDNFTNDYGMATASTEPYFGKEYMSKHVGDRSDTSPYPFNANAAANPNYPSNLLDYGTAPQDREVIRSADFVSRLGNLTKYVAPVEGVASPDYDPAP